MIWDAMEMSLLYFFGIPSRFCQFGVIIALYAIWNT